MSDRQLAHRIITDDATRAVYLSCLAAENAKVTWRNRNALENAPARVEARAWDQTKACMARLAERAA